METKRPWWKRFQKGVQTSTEEKKETPEGLWHLCENCKGTMLTSKLVENLMVCPECNYHEKINAADYFNILFDDKKYTELFADIAPVDMLGFVDSKPYTQRIEQTVRSTGLREAIRVAHGTTGGNAIVIAAMDFRFIGGSMGSVVGEKIARAVDFAIEHRTPLLIISRSGGARMQESAYSLMQMAKTAAKLYQLAEEKIPYISLMTDPTTGGVTASYAMLGDFNIAEPGALIGFAGPRVIEETIKKKLPEGFQTSEFQLENGFLDFIVHRRDLKNKIVTLLELLKK
ncbi:MAG: acetyl-CoA carboxylase, carboxyltransferase subunit beta [Chitinophagales bacterium]|nr:acetyl-CoA carboxylase, carboxyltransferase subunit beta [Chitinophagales bacterium]MDW8418883.1 acetyl-CoA carboxylase, carboxyltransferase subunit beta [Chitinophagales bacterium]